MDLLKLAEYFERKYAAKSWDQQPSPYDASAWQKIEGPHDTSLGIPYTAGQVQYYKDQLFMLWNKASGPESELWAKFFRIADSSLANSPIVTKFKGVYSEFVFELQKANLKDSLLLCVDMLGVLKDLRENVSIQQTSDMPQPIRSALMDIIHRIGTRVWEGTKKILSIYDIRKGILNAPEVLEHFNAADIGSWHHGPMANPMNEKPAVQPGDRVLAKTKVMNMIEQNIMEDVDKAMPSNGTNEKERTKLFEKLKKEYYAKARAAKK